MLLSIRLFKIRSDRYTCSPPHLTILSITLSIVKRKRLPAPAHQPGCHNGCHQPPAKPSHHRPAQTWQPHHPSLNFRRCQKMTLNSAQIVLPDRVYPQRGWQAGFTHRQQLPLIKQILVDQRLGYHSLRLDNTVSRFQPDFQNHWALNLPARLRIRFYGHIQACCFSCPHPARIIHLDNGRPEPAAVGYIWINSN